MSNLSRNALLFATGLCLSLIAQAEVKVTDAWVRATVPAQKATGAFFTVTSSEAARLVEARSSVAGVVELHEMKMEAGVMAMRKLDKGIQLPAGQRVELKPGGNHVMLMDLKQAVAEGSQVPLQLVIESAAGQRSTIDVKASARPLTEKAPAHHHAH